MPQYIYTPTLDLGSHFQNQNKNTLYRTKQVMEDRSLLYLLLSLIFLLFALSPRRRRNLPPGPPSLPIIGHLHYLKVPVHRTLQKLSAKYGPVISLWFGSRLVVVVSSSAVVEECFTKNDVVLANRPRLLVGKHVGYNYTTMVASPYGDHWRNLRRIGAIEIFSASRLNKFAGIRRDEVERLLRKLSKNSLHGFSKVQMQSTISELTFNISMRMAAGKRYFGDDVADEDEARQFRELIKQIVSLGGVSNPGDFIPMLNWIPNVFERKVSRLAKRTDAFLQGLIDEHRSNKEEERNTMIDHLLSLQQSEPELYGDQIIKGIILVLSVISHFLFIYLNISIRLVIPPQFGNFLSVLDNPRRKIKIMSEHRNKVWPWLIERLACNDNIYQKYIYYI